MDSNIYSFPLIFLYPEIHFRLLGFLPSMIFRKEPEILFDMPRRSRAGKELPLMLMINDIDRYPFDINKVTITVSQNGKTRILFDISDPEKYRVRHPFDFQSDVFVFRIKPEEVSEGYLFVNAKVTGNLGKKNLTVFNTNIPFISRLPLKCLITSNPLPGNELCSYGDLHVHSQFSQSHVEFGPPASVIDEMAASYGLDFIAVTDHSYDLECRMDNYLKHDIDITRWHKQRQLFEKNNFKTIVILSEEISVLNSRKNTVHLGALNIKNFIAGTHDGARLNSLKSNDLSIHQALDEVKSQGGISFAAHPGAKRGGILSRLVLHRGIWKEDDITDNLEAFQALNSGFSKSWFRARKLWIKALLKGNRLPLVGGNDAHGDFNRYRFVSIPFFSVSELPDRYLSSGKTGLYGKVTNAEDVTNLIKRGKTFITDGPFLSIESSKDPGKCIAGNEINPVEQKDVIIKAISTYEFGYIHHLRCYFGSYTLKKENMIVSQFFKNKELTINIPLNLENISSDGYLRAEMTSINDEERTFTAVTSPCYIQKSVDE